MTSSSASLPADPHGFRRAVLAWARTLDRPLPWRGETDPYRVLVSEVMLQQTQAARVAPIYRAFLRRFPTVGDLAAAPADEVIRAWAGLGYNRRAMHLWRAARAVVERGGFPVDVDGLSQLPGVGAYTARAVAAFAFGVRAGAVDANIRRVLTRVHGLSPDAGVQGLADALAPARSSARWNQALIDLGAVVCRARSPRCGDCPLRTRCAWAAGRRPEAVRQRRGSPAFASTRRFVRGRVVAVLRQGPVREVALAPRLDLPIERVRDAVASLERDGLVRRDGRRVLLAG